MILFHISPKRRRRGIRARGLDPAKSKGRQRVVWLVDWEYLPSLISHIAQHQDTPAAELDVWEVLIHGNFLHKRRPGVYTSRRHVDAACLVGRRCARSYFWRVSK